MVRWDPERKVWRVSVAAYRPGERRRRQSRDVREPNTVDGRRAAELEEAKLKLEVAAVLELELPGGKVPDSFAAAAAAWVDRHPRWSPKTVKETRYALRRYILPTLGATRLDRVTPSQIEGMYADWARVGRADSTMHRWHGMIHSIFADAYRLGLVVKNPMDRVMACECR
jgi:Phage integrase, N-terminal SAM-like domain